MALETAAAVPAWMDRHHSRERADASDSEVAPPDARRTVLTVLATDHHRRLLKINPLVEDPWRPLVLTACAYRVSRSEAMGCHVYAIPRIHGSISQGRTKLETGQEADCYAVPIT